MIITQTPVRISFLGGGTDFPDFYSKEGGMVVSSAIDKYIFVVAKRRFDPNIRVGYSRTELVDTVEELQHDLVREALRKTGIESGIEVTTIADIPSEGSGLGSSSAVTVGLLNAFYQYQGEIRGPQWIAEEACHIEIEYLKKPIGCQDQYICALGGLRAITFHPEGRVEAERIPLSDGALLEFEEQVLLFYTGKTRKADNVLTEQVGQMETNWEALRTLKALAVQAKDDLIHGRFNSIGHAMHEGWALKKKLSSGISNGQINEMYDAAREAGALGGKIAGAGGGGFLLLFCPHGTQTRVRRALSGLRELPFKLEYDGTKAIFNNRRR